MSAGKTKETAGVIGKSYLKEKYKLIFCYIFIAFLFFMVSFLYGYRQIYRNMLYALELALFFGFSFFLWDFLIYYRRCQALMRALQRGEERTQGLQEAKSLPEQLYREMLEDSEKEKRKLLTEYDEKRRDMSDYYTMWTHQIKTPIAAMRLLLQEEGAAACKDSLQKEREELFKIE